MVDVLITHTVESYDDWKPGFDEHASTRREYGSRGYRLYTDAEDRTEVVAMFEWDSAENFARFMAESDVREKMAELGVTGEPVVHVLEEMEVRDSEEVAA